MAAIVTLSALSATRARADDAGEPAVTPYHPTVSNPATLPVPGWIEGEFGGQHIAGDDGSRSDSIPWLLKYAFDENHGVLVGGNAYMHDAPVGVPRTQESATYCSSGSSVFRSVTKPRSAWRPARFCRLPTTTWVSASRPG